MERAKELAAIKRKITKIDPAFAPAIKNLAPCTFGLEKPKVTQYQSLVRAVIAQQVSTAAARTISGRLQEKCGGTITASKVGALSLKQLQSIGLTGAKVRTISELTDASLSGEINFRKFNSMTDEEIIDDLVPLFGIGRWTVEMFLIFHLGRLDVWPVDDLAVRRGWDNLHGNSEPIKPKVLNALGDQFAGMRSVVAWYCWRAS
ncbi:AlkA 3-methyladenine DNA glycosylase/8-oxoguanine DNA glycosylase [Candidatus Nanopelagicaceae bacterium]